MHHESMCVALYMQSNNAREIWLEMDIRDPVTDTCEWGEVPKALLLLYVYRLIQHIQ